MDKPMNGESIARVARHWNLEVTAERPDIPLAGSPERSLFRTVVGDPEGGLFVLEQLPADILARKREIAATVEVLARRGLVGVHPYLRNRNGDFVTVTGGRFWQISPFISGEELPRPEYTLDAWRGKSMARFLVDMRELSEGIPCGDRLRPFSIVAFARDLMEKMARHNPERAAAVKPAFLHLEKQFFPVHEHLPVAFCHGDPHPINVIWGKQTIRAVIDWEFSGYKPDLYDAALIIGCIGMEDPESLRGPFVMAFLEGLQAAGCFGRAGFAVLPEFVLALRFAWLSDWLRKKDDEMAEMETDYIALLTAGRDELRRGWGL